MKPAPKTTSQLKTRSANLFLRPACRHVTKAGRRCHFPAVADSLYCLGHITRHDAQIVATHESDLDADLTPHFPETRTLDLRTACDVNDFLSTLAKLIVRNQISTRRASVLAYIASLQLRTLPAIDHELNGDNFDSDDVPPRLIFDAPDTPTAPNDARADAVDIPTAADNSPSANFRPYSSLSGTTVPSPS